MRKLVHLSFLLLMTPLLSQEEKDFEINLKNPEFIHGAVTTTEGGIICAENMRIQAQKIEYIDRVEEGKHVRKVIAEGDLLMIYGNRAFVGSRLEFDFLRKTGTLWEGKTFTNYWFLGGDKIELHEDGSFSLYNAFITTSESQDRFWDIHTSRIGIQRGEMLSSRAISFRFFKFPVFWFPSFKADLKFFSSPPLRYKVTWDKTLGPRLSMRYRLYSWENFNLFFRFDYRLKLGPGAAIESEYNSPNGQTSFLTRSYAAHDKTVPDERSPFRYRYQGLFHTQSLDEATVVDATYDKLSDDKMPGDFKSDDFEINTRLRTRFLLTHHQEKGFFSLNVEPRINSFQSINQELPLLTASVHPFELGRTGIISENDFSAGYLDYVFEKHIHEHIPNTHSSRIATRNRLYRPLSLAHINVTPYAEAIGIFYSNSPENRTAAQGIFSYGGTLSTRLFGRYACHRHLIEPYLTYTGLTTPTSSIHDHYIFSLQDGYERINLIQPGIRNTLFSLKPATTFGLDLYLRGFIDDDRFDRFFPKAYSDLSLLFPSLGLTAGVCWNMEEQILDYSNLRLGWTLNQNVAFSVEFRHRSKYDWRKADHDNFILDMARPISQLLDSPLSDGRDTLITKLELRITPTIRAHLETAHGWGRAHEPRYNKEKIEIFKMLTSRFRLRLGYEHTPNDDRFTGGISLVK